jgi:hypothetical protein
MVEEKKEPPKASQTPPFEWTPETIREAAAALIGVIKEFGDRYIALKEKEFDHEARLATGQAKADWRVLGIFLGFLAFVVGLMTYLALNGRVSSDALLFLVGTISGYVLVIVQRHLFPESIEVAAPE